MEKTHQVFQLRACEGENELLDSQKLESTPGYKMRRPGTTWIFCGETHTSALGTLAVTGGENMRGEIWACWRHQTPVGSSA